MLFEIIYKDLPKDIILIYTTICDKKFGIINQNVTHIEKTLLEEACHFLYDNNFKNRIIHKGDTATKEENEFFEQYIINKKTMNKESFQLTKIKEKRKIISNPTNNKDEKTA